jgi:hypothetical protein
MSKVRLMERVTELEMQLERCKASSPSDSERLDEFLSRPSSSSASVKSEKTVNSSQSSEECLVYGPINREPEEKLNPWKFEKKESGIRKFFSSVFKTNSPRRGSNLSGHG